MPKLSPQRIDEIKWERATAYVRAVEAYLKERRKNAFSKQTVEAFRVMKYAERQFRKVQYR